MCNRRLAGRPRQSQLPRNSSPVRQVYDLRGNPIPQQEFGTPGVPGGPDRVFIVPAQGDNAPQVYVVRGEKEQWFSATNRTLEQQQKRGFITSKSESELLSVEELQGKRVLDLAAGTEGQTVRDLRALGIAAQGMDIALSESARQTGYLERADIATTVPFKGQFDIAFELFGGLAYDLGEHTGAAFQNAISRVKPGGTLYLAPLPTSKNWLHEAGA
jgi:SAM-dependent methyltransferase